MHAWQPAEDQAVLIYPFLLLTRHSLSISAVLIPFRFAHDWVLCFYRPGSVHAAALFAIVRDLMVVLLANVDTSPASKQLMAMVLERVSLRTAVSFWLTFGTRLFRSMPPPYCTRWGIPFTEIGIPFTEIGVHVVRNPLYRNWFPFTEIGIPFTEIGVHVVRNPLYRNWCPRSSDVDWCLPSDILCPMAAFS